MVSVETYLLSLCCVSGVTVASVEFQGITFLRLYLEVQIVMNDH